MTFADAAIKLAGHAALLLGWRPDDFWNATPAELQAIVAACQGKESVADGAMLSQLMELYPDG